MARTILDLKFDGYTAVLLRNPDGTPALWIYDEKLGGGDFGTRYSINDVNDKVAVHIGDDLDAIVAQWKRSVGWDDGTQG